MLLRRLFSWREAVVVEPATRPGSPGPYANDKSLRSDIILVEMVSLETGGASDFGPALALH